jgi:Cys-tRNA(Pro)/Cys-tRNA(Cys) deacylase
VASKGTPATALLTREKIAFTTHTYDVAVQTPNYGSAVAAAIGADPDRVFKTLVAEVDGRLTVGIVPVSGDLDLKALASAAGGKKAAMAAPSDAVRVTGYVVGGISPFGQRTRLPMYLDRPATDWPTIYVSGGRRGLQIEVSPVDLLLATGAVSAPIATPHRL